MVSRRGFVTLATGSILYYEVARNLLRSYRWFSRNPLPFAIICEEENEFTSDFDDVIRIDNPTHSILDKLRLPELVPYDETIFIDADCLAYRDLNGLWNLFAHSGDFAVLGEKYPLDSGEGWINREGAGVFRDRVKFSLAFNGGIYYLRKKALGEFSETCKYILDHFDSFEFSYPFKTPGDEIIYALACAVHGYEPALCYVYVYCFYPYSYGVEMDIRKGKLLYRTANNQLYPSRRFLTHWSMAETKGQLYRREVARLESLLDSARHSNRFWEILNYLRDFRVLALHSVCKHLPYGLKADLFRFLKGIKKRK
ncbi:MAG: hypothetical protein J5886_02695 [Bacteroidales bacterium]|nr:hypothetical protein [Bacteroidales bacterium]